MTASNDKPQYLVLGEILRPHGVRGELRMKVYTDYPERLLKDVKMIFLSNRVDDADPQKYTIQSARFHKTYLLIKLQDVPDRNAAELLRGQIVLIHIDDAVPLEDGEFYLFELIGLTVKTDDGRTLGTIKDVMETGANDVYIVNSVQYGQLLIPAHDETLKEINLEDGIVIVTLPDGLLTDDDNIT